MKSFALSLISIAIASGIFGVSMIQATHECLGTVIVARWDCNQKDDGTCNEAQGGNELKSCSSNPDPRGYDCDGSLYENRCNYSGPLQGLCSYRYRSIGCHITHNGTPTPPMGNGNVDCDGECTPGAGDCMPNLSCDQRGPNYVCWGNRCEPTVAPTPVPPRCAVSGVFGNVCLNSSKTYTVVSSGTGITSTQIQYRPPAPFAVAGASGNITFSQINTYDISCQAVGAGGTCAGFSGCSTGGSVNVRPTPVGPVPTVQVTPAGPPYGNPNIAVSWDPVPYADSYDVIQTEDSSSGNYTTTYSNAVSPVNFPVYCGAFNYSYQVVAKSIACSSSNPGPKSASVSSACNGPTIRAAANWYQVENGSVGAKDSFTDPIPGSSPAMVKTNGNSEGLGLFGPTPPALGQGSLGTNFNVPDALSLSTIVSNYGFDSMVRRIKAKIAFSVICESRDIYASRSGCFETGVPNVYYFSDADDFETTKDIDVDGETRVLIVNGKTTIKHNITVKNGGLFILLSKGDIRIAKRKPMTFICTPANSGTPDLAGIFYTAGKFDASINSVSELGTLYVEGSIVGLGGINFKSYVPDICSPDIPITYIKYRSDFTSTIPDLLKFRRIQFREGN